MRSIVFGLAAACLTYAQQDGGSGSVTLARIRSRMAENLSRLPNYTCAQTTKRSRRRSVKGAFEAVDTVRLEVALVEGKELFGWPGAKRIDEADLTRLIGTGGALGNGSFALLAKGVFLSPATAFRFKGETLREGQRAVQFEYRVPRQASGYHLKVGGNDATVGYHGSFWADAETLDLTRLEIYADDIPPELGLASATDAMDYGRVPIGASEFVLPRRAELSMASASGLADRNVTRFHECRQYAGESVLSFVDVPEETVAAAVAAAAVPEIALPDDFQVELALETPITWTSAIGDVVKARLLHNIRERHKTVVTKGAVLSGRITVLHRDDGWYHAGIAFTDMDAAEGHADLSPRVTALFARGGVRELHPAPMQLGFHGKRLLGAGEFADSGERPLNLKAGYRIVLRSRLLQSGR